MMMDLHEFYSSDKDNGYDRYGQSPHGDSSEPEPRHNIYERNVYDDGYGEDPYNDDRDDDYYDDDYGYDDDEIGYLNRELWEYEAEFDRAAREIEKNHRSPAAKILFGLLVIAAALAIYLGVSEYAGNEGAEEAEVRVSFVRADERGESFSCAILDVGGRAG